MNPSIIIADDHPLVLKGLHDFLIEQNFDVLASAKNGKEAFALIKAHSPDIAILDIKMPFFTGLEIAEKCKEDGLKIIEEKYKVKSNKIVIYFHYHPSTWRLHIHFQNINAISNRSMTLPRAHPLSLVIQNLKMDSDYYKKCLLEVVVEEKIGASV